MTVIRFLSQPGRGTQELLRPQSLANPRARAAGERLLRKADRHHAPRVPRLCYSAWRETPAQLTERMGRALQSIAPTFEPWSWNPGALDPGAAPEQWQTHAARGARESWLAQCWVDYTMSTDLRKLRRNRMAMKRRRNLITSPLDWFLSANPVPLLPYRFWPNAEAHSSKRLARCWWWIPASRIHSTSRASRAGSVEWNIGH